MGAGLSMLLWLSLDALFPLDGWLTEWVSRGGRWWISLLSSENPGVYCLSEGGAWQLRGAGAKMAISHSCNGKAILFLFNAFIWAMPGVGMARRVGFSLLGTGSLMLANMLRVAALYCIYRYLPGWFGFFHHSVFQLTLYGLVLGGWILFLRKTPSNSST